MTTLDPHLALQVTWYPYIDVMYNRLVHWDANFNPAPELAESWTTSPDGLTWTFKLRKDVKFSDGNPLTADAVKYSFDRIKDPATGSGRGATFAIMDDIKVVDDYTVAIHTSRPYAPLLEMLAFPAGGILEPAVAKQYAVKDYGVKKPIGSGPFKLKDWPSADKIVFERNDLYWGPKPQYDQLIYVTIPDDQTRSLAVEKGEADLARNFPVDNIKRFKTLQDADALVAPGLYVMQIEPNLLKPPFDNKQVRHALSIAIDRQAICRDVLLGVADPADGVMATGQWAKQVFPVPEYNPDKAKQLLAQAGLPNGFSFELAVAQGSALKAEQVAPAVQGYLKAIGVNMTIKFMENVTATNTYARAKAADKPGPVMWVRGNAGTDLNIYRMFSSDNLTNLNAPSGYNNPEVDKLFEAGQKEFDTAKRAEIYKQLQTIVWNDDVYTFLYSERMPVGFRKTVGNIKFEANQYPLFAEMTKG